MSGNQTFVTVYWVLVSFSLLFIIGSIFYLFRTVQQPGCINSSMIASFLSMGLFFYIIAILLDKFIMREAYLGPSTFNHNRGDGIYRRGGADVKKEIIGRDDQARTYNGIGDINAPKNDPRENKIPNLKLQSATDLVDYTTVRNSLSNSFQGAPFSFGAEANTRIKSNPNGF